MIGRAEAPVNRGTPCVAPTSVGGPIPPGPVDMARAGEIVALRGLGLSLAGGPGGAAGGIRACHEVFEGGQSSAIHVGA